MKIPKIQREEIEQTRSMILNQEKIYDPNSSERICCIELENNNKVYLSYKETSTIRDVRYLYLLFFTYPSSSLKNSFIIASSRNSIPVVTGITRLTKIFPISIYMS